MSEFCHLTDSEEELMMLFWSKDTPLKSMDILNDADNCRWSDSNLRKILRALEDKEMIRVHDFISLKYHNVKRYVPTITKEEYIAKIVVEKGLEEGNISKTLIALVNETGWKDKATIDNQMIEVMNYLEKSTKEE